MNLKQYLKSIKNNQNEIDNITEEIQDKIKNDVERMFGLVMC